MTTARWPPRYAARVARVTASGGHEGDDTIMFASGDAYPESLPDVSEFAQLAATKYRTETLQYAPRPGLPELREWIAGHLAGEGIPVSTDSILVCNGAVASVSGAASV
jgi:DNA-binding transcriptional MocR family regulator